MHFPDSVWLYFDSLVCTLLSLSSYICLNQIGSCSKSMRCVLRCIVHPIFITWVCGIVLAEKFISGFLPYIAAEKFVYHVQLTGFMVKGLDRILIWKNTWWLLYCVFLHLVEVTRNCIGFLPPQISRVITLNNHNCIGFSWSASVLLTSDMFKLYLVGLRIMLSLVSVLDLNPAESTY